MNGRARLTALAALALAAGCATAPDALETAERVPVPRTAELAGTEGAAPPPVLPTPAAAAAQEHLAALRERGSATLADCLRLAEATNESLLSGDEDRLRAYLQRDVAVAGLFPTVALTGTFFRQDRVPQSGMSGFFTTAADREQWALTVRQPLFKGFVEVNARDFAVRTAAAREATISVLRIALRRSVARAFFGVLQAQEQIRTLEETERLDRTRIEEMRARQEHGLARRTEVLLLESAHQNTLAALRRARTEHDVTRTVLDQLLGVDLPVPVAPGPAAEGPLPARKEAVVEALRSRPELPAADLDAEAAEAAVRVAQAGYWPSLSLVGNWYLWRRNYSAFQQDTDWDAALELAFPFFEGGATRARERMARVDLRKARLAQSAAVGRVVQDVESALARAAADQELLATFERNVELARENLRLLEEEYRHGIATSLEVLTARNVLEEARLDAERQRLQSRLDRVELLLSLGRTEIEP